MRQSGSDRSWWALPAAILLAALALRLGIVVATRASFRLITDNAYYSDIAASLARGHGFGPALFPGLHGPSAFRSPLYPTLLAPIYWLFGVHPLLGRLENQLFGTMAVASIGLLARTLLPRRFALTAMAMAAVYPALLLDGYGLRYEPLLITLTCLAMAAVVRYAQQPGQWRWLVIAGLLIGLGVLTRETAALLLVPLALLVARVTGARPLAVLVRVGLATGLAVTVVLPWTLRNYAALHAFVPVSTDVAFAVEGTYNPTAAHYPGNPAFWVVPYGDPGTLAAILASNRTEVSVEHLLEHRAFSYVAAHPTYPLEAMAWNSIRMFDLRGWGDELFIAPEIPFDPLLVKLAVGSFYLLLAGAAAGFCLSEVRAISWPVWSFPVLAAVVTSLVIGDLLYRSVLEAYVILPASVAAVRAWEGRGRVARYHHPLRTRATVSTEPA